MFNTPNKPLIFYVTSFINFVEHKSYILHRLKCSFKDRVFCTSTGTGIIALGVQASGTSDKSRVASPSPLNEGEGLVYSYCVFRSESSRISGRTRVAVKKVLLTCTVRFERNTATMSCGLCQVNLTKGSEIAAPFSILYLTRQQHLLNSYLSSTGNLGALRMRNTIAIYQALSLI